jgi:hypothetical protein
VIPDGCRRHDISGLLADACRIAVIILSLRVRPVCGLWRPGLDSVGDGTLAADSGCFTPLDRYLVESEWAAGHRVRGRDGGGVARSRR